MLSTLSKRIGHSSKILQQITHFEDLQTKSWRFSTRAKHDFVKRNARNLTYPSNNNSKLTFSNDTISKSTFLNDFNVISKSSLFRHQSTTAQSVISSNPVGGISVTTSPDKKCLVLSETGEEAANFHSIWLRHNCQCSKCKQPYSGQKMIDVSELRTSYTISSVYLEQNDVVCVEWNEEAHRSIFPVSFLTENRYSESALHRIKSSSELLPDVLAGKLPQIRYEEVFEEKGILKWMHVVDQHGLCLVRGVPVEEGTVRTVAEKMWPVQHTIYGFMWDVKSDPQPINIAYSDVKLDFHMDLAYYESPPGIQFLHCLQFDEHVIGGESIFVDAWHVAEALRSQHPEDFDILTRVPATFQKIHSERDHPVRMTYQRPHIMTKPEGQIIGVFWAPAFEGPLRVRGELVEPYYKAYNRFTTLMHSSPTRIEFRLVPGDLISFNNRRMLHARREFSLNGGVRHLQGCYLNIDEFKSCLEVLSRKTGQVVQIKHVLNQSWC